jgi:hypothetical protein
MPTIKLQIVSAALNSAPDPVLTYMNDRKTAIGYSSNRYTNVTKRKLFDEDFRAFTQHRVDSMGRASAEKRTWEEHCLDRMCPMPVAGSLQVLPHYLERPVS